MKMKEFGAPPLNPPMDAKNEIDLFESKCLFCDERVMKVYFSAGIHEFLIQIKVFP